MDQHDPDARQGRLITLLGPIHDRARESARRLCRSRADGDDLFHEAVLRAFDRLGELRDEARFRQWFYAVLLSVHRASCRRGFWRRFLSLSEVEEHREPAGDDGLLWEEGRLRAARMADALARLPAVQREAVVLFEVDGFSIEEIAGMQGRSTAAVKSRLARGRARLRRHYEALRDADEARPLEVPAPGPALKEGHHG